jgi:hypothetical protein
MPDGMRCILVDLTGQVCRCLISISYRYACDLLLGLSNDESGTFEGRFRGATRSAADGTTTRSPGTGGVRQLLKQSIFSHSSHGRPIFITRFSSLAGFMSRDLHSVLPRLFFTAAGLAALRMMMRDRRLADPEKFAHIRGGTRDRPANGKPKPLNWNAAVRVMPSCPGRRCTKCSPQNGSV